MNSSGHFFYTPSILFLFHSIRHPNLFIAQPCINITSKYKRIDAEAWGAWVGVPTLRKEKNKLKPNRAFYTITAATTTMFDQAMGYSMDEDTWIEISKLLTITHCNWHSLACHLADSKYQCWNVACVSIMRNGRGTPGFSATDRRCI